MGRPKVKIIDDSQPEAEVKDQKSKIKDSNKEKRERAKSEVVKAISEVEQTSKPVILGSTSTSLSVNSATPESKQEDSGQALPAGRQASMAKEKKAQKLGKAKPRGKKYQEITKDLDRNKVYPINEAVDTVKKLSYTKFNATLEAHINTSQTGIRGLVSLPFAAGKKLRILAFGKDADTFSSVILNKAKRSEESLENASLKQVERSFANAQDDTIKAGTDETIEEINKGKIDFDLVVTTPEWMPKLARVARILGPRGLMPNPKNGTITQDLKKAVEGFQSGKTEYKTESKAPVIHMAIGKLDQPSEELIANIKTLLQTLGKSRVKKVTLSPTMGPSVKLDLGSL
ncbi:50S ribosomal protein L1 [Candidatus Daviesbacteria bacterium]|nr:50S ribosomal protein L1 [Candidatus Daviesbacteria bacterium]